MFPKMLLSVIFLLGLLGSVLAVGELKITRDTSIGSDREAYNSKCTFKTQPSDADFLKMVEAAYNEMQDLPGLQKGKAGTPNGHDWALYQQRKLCGRSPGQQPRRRPPPPQHGNQGSCGEIMSTLLWMVDNKNESPRDHNPKIAAWYPKGYLPPCSSEPESVKWGCAQWTQKMGLRVVQKIDDLPDDYTKPEKTEPVQLAKCLEVEVDENETNQI
ncbi:hypothetical protein N7465_007734 [Penicillium sp. CMV-2018d]|nr:hypothetical protein N7465_007734 [Penicillium sp. CMV-2018d]